MARLFLRLSLSATKAGREVGRARPDSRKGISTTGYGTVSSLSVISSRAGQKMTQKHSLVTFMNATFRYVLFRVGSNTGVQGFLPTLFTLPLPLGTQHSPELPYERAAPCRRHRKLFTSLPSSISQGHYHICIARSVVREVSSLLE
jgi:hypothetical protein